MKLDFLRSGVVGPTYQQLVTTHGLAMFASNVGDWVQLLGGCKSKGGNSSMDGYVNWRRKFSEYKNSKTLISENNSLTNQFNHQLYLLINSPCCFYFKCTIKNSTYNVQMVGIYIHVKITCATI